ncbi:NRDE family protein [Derxia gummosa]|uniref:NRDE family protein n=1 Tax=Derxia gummosa DSM 723 TaxID=1121388 RepID=A0A8B6X447_9BURK|nr:NRDE family protein [Derxia gummosa]
MCLIVFDWRPDARHGHRLLVAANRDEFHHRDTRPLQFWPGREHILGGIDDGARSEDGLPGTWMGVTRGGRFAALTNYRAPRDVNPSASSRGRLVSEFLASDLPPAEYLLDVQSRSRRYNGFNLLVGSTLGPDPQLWWHSNRSGQAPLRLKAGLYGLSNALLDTPWPKVRNAVGSMLYALAASSERTVLFRLLGDDRQAPDDELPRTGVTLARERLLSSVFIRSDDYGTRSSQVLDIGASGRIDYIERSFLPDLGPGVFQERQLEVGAPVAAAGRRADERGSAG